MRHHAKTRHRDRDVSGLRVHYRESGVPSPAAVVLLHGSPSSSFSFREVLPALGETTYVIAPDLPGFGFSDTPAVSDFDYTWERLSHVVEALLDGLGVERFVLFVTDFSTPVGYYLSTRRPHRVLGLVVQNGNVHEAGLGKPWLAVRRYWAEPTEENLAALPQWLDFEGTRATYLAGLPPELVELHPRESWHLDWERMSRPGLVDVHWRLFLDYQNHVARFDEIAAYHQRHQPPCLVLWGRRDTFFDIGEVLAFHGALDRLEAHVYDAGHFLLESHAAEVSERLTAFAADTLPLTAAL